MEGNSFHDSRTHSECFPHWIQAQGREGGRQCESQGLCVLSFLDLVASIQRLSFNKAQLRMGMAPFEMPPFK